MIEINEALKICKHCGRSFEKNWAKSVVSPFCSCKCSRAYSTAAKRAEINAKVSKSLDGISTCKGGRVNVLEAYNKNPKHCLICDKVLPYEKRKSNTCSLECQRKLSVQTARTNDSYKNTGGYREGSGRSKSGYWKGDFCGSTYELVYWIYCKEHNIPIERNTKRYPFTFEGKEHTYLPDYIVDGELVEIKGYVTPLVYAKAAAVKEGIKILTIKDLQPMMEYVDSVYGTHHKGKVNNYQTLFDEYKPSYKYVCSHCGKEFYSETKKATVEKFCSQSCAGRFSRNPSTDLIDESTVRLISVPVPNYNGLWFDGKNLYSNRVIRKDKKFIKCKLQNLTWPTPRYKVSKNKYMSIASLRELCGFSELE